MRLYSLLVLALLAQSAAYAQSAQRPQILGIAHISLLASDFEASRSFYRDLLGFAEPYSLKDSAGAPSMTFFKVNERQYIELAPEKSSVGSRLSHFALQVSDAEAMRIYLQSRGVAVPDHVPTGRIGNANFMIKDPQGVNVEIVQYGATSWTLQAQGKYLSERRISSHIKHVGFVVTDLQPELDFYTNVLGLREFWRGSKDGRVLSWINLELPESDDYIELMLYGKAPSGNTLGSANHLCLEVPNADESLVAVKQRASAATYQRPLEVHVGKNGKRQLNLYDPDGTRTEVMEPNTVDGQAVASSTAPPPTP